METLYNEWEVGVGLLIMGRSGITQLSGTIPSIRSKDILSG